MLSLAVVQTLVWQCQVKIGRRLKPVNRTLTKYSSGNFRDPALGPSRIMVQGISNHGPQPSRFEL